MNEDDSIVDPSKKPDQSTNSAKHLFKIILGGILIAFILLLTILYIKMLPILIKVLALAVNACAHLYVLHVFVQKQKKIIEWNLKKLPA
jgi:hypothetical protein